MHAFGEQLPNEPRSARADGETDTDFFAPFRGAREQEIGQIDAGE